MNILTSRSSETVGAGRGALFCWLRADDALGRDPTRDCLALAIGFEGDFAEVLENH